VAKVNNYFEIGLGKVAVRNYNADRTWRKETYRQQEVICMSEQELRTRNVAEQLKKLPVEVQERVCYIIQGAALVASNYALNTEQPRNPPVDRPA